MTQSSKQFYDDLSDSYHLIFKDWEDAVSWQGEVLHQFISKHGYRDQNYPIRLLDASCGIGTQALGLARYDYQITATDLSPKSIERAKREATRKGLHIEFGVADFRTLDKDVPGQFDIVLSADNAIPHLLTDEDLLMACRNFHAKLEPEGFLILTLRDYDEVVREKPTVTMPRIMDEGKRVVFQEWNWQNDGKIYTLRHFILTEKDGMWQTQVHETTYRALLREELSNSLEAAGFGDIQYHLPDSSGYYQPIVTARK